MVGFEEPTSNNEGGILACLWRKIIDEAKFKGSLNILIDMYLKRADVTDGRVSNVKRKTKSTLISNIVSSEMTFKTFLDLVIRVLRVKKLVISIKLEHRDGRETEHHVTVKGEE